MRIIFLLAMFLTACNINPKPPLEHDFGAGRPIGASRSAEAKVSVDAPKWLWDKGIRYRLLYKGPTQIGTYSLDRWIAPPPELFEQLLLTNGKLLDYSLKIKLLEFEQQFLQANQAKVILRFQVEAQTADKLKKIGQEFYLERPTLSPDAAGAVNAFALLTQQAIDRISLWLSQQAGE